MRHTSFLESSCKVLEGHREHAAKATLNESGDDVAFV